MALVKGPNGLVYDWPEHVVAALVLGADHERVAPPEPEKKRATSRRPAAKK